MSSIAGNWFTISLRNHHMNSQDLCAIELHVYPFKLLFEYINIYSFKFWTDGNKDLDEHGSTSSEGNIYFEFSMKVQDLK